MTKDLKEMWQFLLVKLLGKEILALQRLQLVEGPPTDFIDLIMVGLRRLVGDETKGCDEFSLSAGLPDVLEQKTRCLFSLGIDGWNLQAQLFARLTLQGLSYPLAIVDVATHSGVPESWSNVLVDGTFLQTDTALLVHEMQVDDGMQRHGARVTVLASCLTDDVAFLVNEGEHLCHCAYAGVGYISEHCLQLLGGNFRIVRVVICIRVIKAAKVLRD